MSAPQAASACSYSRRDGSPGRTRWILNEPSLARLIAAWPAMDRAMPPGWPGSRSGATGSAGAAGERLAPPRAELIALGVGEPVDPLAGGVDRGVGRALGPVGHLAVGAAGTVPGVDLPGAGGVGAIDRAVRGEPCPGGQRHARRSEPGLPAFLGLHPAPPPPSRPASGRG